MGATVRLPDGRVLGIERLGRPGATPVLAFHGLPGSRLDFLTESRACAQAGVELIAADRPGFGLSSPQAGRVLLGRFSVLGYSAGAKYVLACAFALPERVEAAALASGSAPPDMPGGEEGMIEPERLVQWASLHAQPLARGSWRLLPARSSHKGLRAQSERTGSRARRRPRRARGPAREPARRPAAGRQRDGRGLRDRGPRLGLRPGAHRGSMPALARRSRRRGAAGPRALARRPDPRRDPRGRRERPSSDLRPPGPVAAALRGAATPRTA